MSILFESRSTDPRQLIVLQPPPIQSAAKLRSNELKYENKKLLNRITQLSMEREAYKRVSYLIHLICWRMDGVFRNLSQSQRLHVRPARI